MPDSVPVIAFIFGSVLVIAALIGKDVKIAAVELPALDKPRRAVAAVFGALLMGYGVLDRIEPPPSSQPPTATPGIASATSRSPDGATTGSSMSDALCLSDVPAGDVLNIPVERGPRSDRKFSSGQPRNGLIGIHIFDSERTLGYVKMKTQASGVGLQIMAVLDANCATAADYKNLTRPEIERDYPLSYDTFEYRFPAATIVMDVAYTEGSGQLSVRAQQPVR